MVFDVQYTVWFICFQRIWPTFCDISRYSAALLFSEPGYVVVRSGVKKYGRALALRDHKLGVRERALQQRSSA